MNRIVHYYVKWIVARHFHEVLFNGIEIDKNRSVLLIANHFSFWDGLILYCVTQLTLKKNFHVMMGDDTAQGIYALKYAGAFTVVKHSREVFESINHAANLLNNPGNLVLIFPQGKLFSNYVNQMQFQKGVMRIMKQAAGKYQMVFASTFIQYFKHKKPTATVYLKRADANFTTIDELTSAYQQHYSASKLLQTEFDI